MQTEPQTLVSKSEFARLRGVSPQMVTKWLKAGRIVLAGGKVNVEETDALLLRALDPRRGGTDGGPLRWAHSIRASALTDVQFDRLMRAAGRAAFAALLSELNIVATPTATTKKS